MTKTKIFKFSLEKFRLNFYQTLTIFIKYKKSNSIIKKNVK